MADYWMDVFIQHEREGAEKEARLPVCDCCGQPIWDAWYYEINGDKVCDNCVIDNLHDNCEVENEELNR